MISSSEDNTNHLHHTACPYLGLSDDPKTFSAFPSDWNVCYHVSPSSTPTSEHQRNYCLKAAYSNCPIYNTQSGQKMPKDLQSYKRGFSNLYKYRIRIVIISVFVLLIVSGIMVSNLLDIDPIGLFSQPENTPQSNLMELSQNISQTLQKTAIKISPAQTITKTYTEPPPTPTRVVTSTPTEKDPIFTLDTPIGDETQFIIHRVSEGESLQIFADRYNTSVEAIRAVNYDLIAPLWIDWLVIIPVNTTEVADFPTFEPYQVEEEILALINLSEDLSIPLDALVLYNNLYEEYILHQGEWLLIPREKFEP